MEMVAAWNLGKTLDDYQRHRANQLDEILFVEAGLNHQMDDGQEFVAASNDGAQKCRLSTDKQKLRLTPFAPRSIPTLVKSRQFLLRTHCLRSLPVELYERRPQDSLTVSLGPTMYPGRNLQLVEDYDRPHVSLESDGSALAVDVDGEKILVSPNSELTKTLESRSVTVSRPTDEFRQVPSRDGGTQKRRKYETVSRSVDPELRVNHHGSVSVLRFDGEESG